ncbi:MAG: hypothetical protein ACTSYF_03475 [Promethearchaeota archaeon]
MSLSGNMALSGAKTDIYDMRGKDPKRGMVSSPSPRLTDVSGF